MSTFRKAAVFAACLLFWDPAFAVQDIPLKQLRRMFAEMRANPDHNKWNVDGELLWGYFFTDPDRNKLQTLADDLATAGYKLVAIHPTEDNHSLLLHVEKVEHHTPESLNTRNHEFYELARKHCLQSYDGMDVGPVN